MSHLWKQRISCALLLGALLWAPVSHAQGLLQQLVPQDPSPPPTPGPPQSRTPPKDRPQAKPIEKTEAELRAAAVFRAPVDYPKEAKEQNLTGDVVVQITVDKAGRVEASHLVSGPELLRQAVLKSIVRWRFTPLKVYGGTPARMIGNLTFHYPP